MVIVVVLVQLVQAIRPVTGSGADRLMQTRKATQRLN